MESVPVQDYNTSIMSLGIKIREARDKKGLSQEKLAQKAGITASTMYKIEKDKINPTFKVVVGIAKALNISLETLR